MKGFTIRTAGTRVVQYRLLVMLVAVAVFGGLTVDDFLTINTLQSVIDRATVVGFLALGLTPVLIAGQIDLSIGSTMSMAGITTIFLQSYIGNIPAALVGLAVGVLIGFRPTATPIEWLATFGLIALVAFAITWIAVGMGMQAKSVETASNLPLLLVLLPFLGSGFVPTESMPAGLQWFAEYQPFTPIVETLRGLLLGTPLGWNAVLAVGWCIVITVIGYVWSMVIYERKSVR